MKSTKESKGITLLALIITIIVLLILAGVALNTLFGSNGIISNSKYAQEEYIRSAEKDAITKAFAELKIKLYTDDSITAITAELVEQQLNEGGNNVEVEDGENGNFVITFKNTGNQYTVNSNGAILGEEKTEVANVPLEITGDIECTGGETTILVKVPTNVDTRATYIYHYKEEGGTEQTATSNSSTYTIEGLTVNKNYEVWVEAYNDYNEEHVISNHVTVRTEYGPYITVPSDFSYNGGTITGFNPDAASGVATMAKSGDRKVILALPEYALDEETVVTSISSKAFKSYTNLITLTIPTSITSIGESAFEGCNKITNVTIPTSVTSMGNWTFAYCTSLTNEDVERIMSTSSLNKLSRFMFCGCTGITQITIPDNITSIEKGVFKECSNLEEITVSKNLKSAEIENGDHMIFYRCYKIKKITFEEGTTTILPGLFCNAGLSEGVEIIIPTSVTSIGNRAFSGCTGITNITIPTSVTSIGESAFNGCNKITNVTIPTSVTSMGNWTFAYCTSLTNEDVERIMSTSSLNKLSRFMFCGCTGITQITIPDNITSIEKGVFKECSNLEEITVSKNLKSAEIENGDHMIFYRCYKIKKITFEEGTTTILPGLFCNAGLASNAEVVIPTSVKSIGNNAFSGCANLTTVTYSGTNEQWNAISIGSGNTAITNIKPQD